MTIVEVHTELLKFLLLNMVEPNDCFASVIYNDQNFEFSNFQIFTIADVVTEIITFFFYI